MKMPPVPSECGKAENSGNAIRLFPRGKSAAVMYWIDRPEGRAALAAYCVTVLEWLRDEADVLADCDIEYAWIEYLFSLTAWRDEWKRWGGLP